MPPFKTPSNAWWCGSGRHWQHYRQAYLLLGGLATPLVVSVHTIVSFDFAVSLVPGWHETVFPPYLPSCTATGTAASELFYSFVTSTVSIHRVPAR